MIQGIKRELNRDDCFVFNASPIEKSCLSISENNLREINHSYKKGIKFEIKCLQVLKEKGFHVEQT